jgi:hypothetical protein
MLINCPDCVGAVSDMAFHCPHCGRPINAVAGHASVAFADPAGVQLTEKTSKKWKAHAMIGGLLALAGALLLGIGTISGTDTAIAPGVLITGIGFVWLLGAKLGAWWFHG